MQAHALTPRLVAALQNPTPDEDLLEWFLMENIGVEPEFPFLSVLASGGHTLLIHSASLVDHRVMATTNDIAVGECLDKAARAVLPPEILQRAKSTMYGALLEKFAFSDLASEDPPKKEKPEIDLKGKREQQAEYRLEDKTAREYQAMYRTRYAYTVPRNNEEASTRNNTKWGWAFNTPLTKTAGGNKISTLEMSFSGLTTAAERASRYGVDRSTGKLNKIERSAEHISIEERRDMAREVMRAAFEHVASRVILGLRQINAEEDSCSAVECVVMSGGVAANSYLRFMYDQPANTQDIANPQPDSQARLWRMGMPTLELPSLLLVFAPTMQL
jgi:N6-L-threonylcarbamoyladenine synthase